MRKTLVPVLLLATLALSSSNIVPFRSMNEFKIEQLGSSGQQNDNIFSNKYQSRYNLNDVLFNIDDKLQESPDMDNSQIEHLDNSNAGLKYNTAWKNDLNNLKGFRKEQWHNYPRQLDRLNRHQYESRNTDKRNLDPDDPGDEYTDDSATGDNENFKYINLKEIYDPGTRKTIEEAKTAAAVINPLIILKLHLAILRKDADYYPNFEDSKVNVDYTDETIEADNADGSNPKLNVIKVKREGKENDNNESAKVSPKARTMNKRIFSLWSRLQSLNHKGHELHHRRHLYALYGPPDSEGGGGVLTAETRATFMRPPGSPLRWG